MLHMEQLVPGGKIVWNATGELENGKFTMGEGAGYYVPARSQETTP